MEVSALKYSGGIGLHGPSPLLRLQSDDRLVAVVRRGNHHAFEVLVSRYSSRLLAFCRHLLGSREDAEDVLQEVMAAAFNAMLADDRPINVRPWLYRIARNRCLNHLRRVQAVGVDSMDIHLSDNGASTADKVHEREEFRLLVGDIHELPETQKTALVLREMDALSYEQIAEAMETTVPSVKSLLVRARISLAEAAEARVLSCDEVRIELGEVAEGLIRRPSALVRRHLRTCQRCENFRVQLKDTNKALAALLPIGPFVLLKKIALTHLGHSAGSSATAGGASAGASASAGAGAAGSGAAASTAAAGGSLLAGGGAGGFVTAGRGAAATKAAAGLAAAALVTAGAVEVDNTATTHPAIGHNNVLIHAAVSTPRPPVVTVNKPAAAAQTQFVKLKPQPADLTAKKTDVVAKTADVAKQQAPTPPPSQPAVVVTPAVKTIVVNPAPTATTTTTPAPLPGRTQTETDPTLLVSANAPVSGSGATPTTTTTPVVAAPPAPATTTSAPLPPPDPPPTTTDTPPTTTDPSSDPPPSATTTSTPGSPDPSSGGGTTSPDPPVGS
jgi:RNA polymerase sigma factor (sigma-70 family)